MENSITNNTEPQTEKTTLQKVCDMFVSRDELRPAMCTVFTNGNRAYATDTFTLISLPENLIDFEWQQPQNPPKAEPILNEALEKSTKFTLKIADVKKLLDTIPDVDVYEDCKNCDGSGDDVCPHCGNEYPCELCNGTGQSNTIIGRQKEAVQILLEHEHDGHEVKTFINSFVIDKPFKALDMLGFTDETVTVYLQNRPVAPVVLQWNDFYFMAMRCMTADNLHGGFRAIPCK